MKLHGNARTCPHSRRLAIVRLERGWALRCAAEAAGVSVRTISKWRYRYRREGEQGLVDRSSAPARVPSRTPEERVALIALLRRERLTGWQIAERLSMPLSTVSTILTRIGLTAISASGRASCSTSMSRSWAGSAGPATASTAIAEHARAGSAGVRARSRSMTPPAWHTSRCSRTRRP